MPIVATSREFKDLPLGLLDDPELPSRTSMDDTKLEELVASIRSIGLQQPMVVARVGERFEILAGHRRLVACKRAGLVAAPCLIYPSKVDIALEIQEAENHHREDLNPADEALWFAELLERSCGGDVDTLCARLGLKRGYVENRLVLLRDAEILDALRTKKLTTVGVAQQLLRISDPTLRRYYLDAAIRGGATVAVAAGFVQQWQQSARLTNGPSAEPSQASAPAPVPDTHFFTCCCCNGTENVHLMVPINVHSHCKLAILDKLLAAYRGAA